MGSDIPGILPGRNDVKQSVLAESKGVDAHVPVGVVLTSFLYLRCIIIPIDAVN